MSTFNQVMQAIQNAQPNAFLGGTNKPVRDSSALALTLPCDFSASGIPATGYPIDLQKFYNRGYFSTIQTMFLDNSNNNGYALVSNPSLYQSFALPPGWQGYFPVISPQQSGAVFNVTSTGTGLVNVTLINVVLNTTQWAATVTPPTVGNPQPVSDAIVDACVSANKLNVRTIASQFTAVDASGTIAAGGTAQSLMAANANRQGFLIENIDYVNNAEALWISFTGAAQINAPGSFSLAAGSSIAYPGGSLQGVVSNAISVIAATAGHKYSAMQW